MPHVGVREAHDDEEAVGRRPESLPGDERVRLERIPRAARAARHRPGRRRPRPCITPIVRPIHGQNACDDRHAVQQAVKGVVVEPRIKKEEDVTQLERTQRRVRRHDVGQVHLQRRTTPRLTRQRNREALT